MMTKFVIALLIWPSISLAECDGSIQMSDTIGAVKSKMNCLVAENAKLKSELESEKATFTPMRITYTGALCDSQPKQAECVSRAVSLMTKRGWKIATQSSKLAEFTNKDTTVVIDCRSHQVLVAGATLQDAADATRIYNDLIFHGE